MPSTNLIDRSREKTRSWKLCRTQSEALQQQAPHQKRSLRAAAIRNTPNSSAMGKKRRSSDASAADDRRPQTYATIAAFAAVGWACARLSRPAPPLPPPPEPLWKPAVPYPPLADIGGARRPSGSSSLRNPMAAAFAEYPRRGHAKSGRKRSKHAGTGRGRGQRPDHRVAASVPPRGRRRRVRGAGANMLRPPERDRRRDRRDATGVAAAVLARGRAARVFLAARIRLRRIAATPRPVTWKFRGERVAAAPWPQRGYVSDESRRRRGR